MKTPQKVTDNNKRLDFVCSWVPLTGNAKAKKMIHLSMILFNVLLHEIYQDHKT